MTQNYRIGRPGIPWGAAEIVTWRGRQRVQRSYAGEVVAAVDALRTHWDVVPYGALGCEGQGRYSLLALRAHGWNAALPTALVTGGVHGYETSGVQGALLFARRYAGAYVGRINLVVAPCVSPWSYERIQRWNADARDPNRSFAPGTPVGEAGQLMALAAVLGDRVLVHIDLHETTDTDESEFRPALAARDGAALGPGTIPNGFYLCGDCNAPEPAFQQAIIAAVERVTHIAPADAGGTIIGSPVAARGVIYYDYRALGMCAGVTAARWRTTTEVYPDSPNATAAECNEAQVAAARAAIDWALAHA